MSNRYRLLASACSVIFVGVLAAGLLAPAPAQAYNDVGFYFDPQYTEDWTLLYDPPQLVTAYLVLHDPSDFVAGWEGRVSLDGPIGFLTAQLEGESVLNVLQPPSFMVGIGGSPLPPWYNEILLATFQFYVSGTDPSTILLDELFYHSLPEGGVCFLDPQGELVPMNSTPSYVNACEPECGLPWTTLEYTPLAAGGQEERWITILNYNFEYCGSPALDIQLHDYDPGSADNFRLSGLSGVFEEDFRTLQIPVVYQPTGPGYHMAYVRLGEACDVVWVKGICRDPMPGADQVGVFFDTNATGYATTAEPGTTVMAYLCLLNPSSDAGLIAWEGCVEVTGDASIAPSYLGYSAVNELAEPCYRVTRESMLVTDTWKESVILASFEITVNSAEEPVEVLVSPVADAAVAGQLSWTPVGAAGPVAMPTYFDQPAVAWINSTPVAAEAPRPLASSYDRSVTLSWTVNGRYDGCNVYRRTDGEQPARLNAEPLAVSGGSFTYVDDPVGYDSGQTLYYSYALLSGGAEIAVSPEVEVQWNVPAVAETRLLAPTPNPFNPRTEIRWEMKAPGPARITIHDLAGKRVRTLVDEDLAAGPGSREWYGKDDQGRRLPSGVYMMRLVTQDRITQGKLMLLK